MGVTVVLADDHELVRGGARTVLNGTWGVSVVGEAANGPQALEAVSRLRPDVLVLDLGMPGMHGLDVSRHIKAIRPRKTHVVILSMESGEDLVAEAFKSGASGYVLKDDGAGELVRAVKCAAQGKRFLSPSISSEAVQEARRRAIEAGKDPYLALSPRQRQILMMTAEGKTSTEIAKHLRRSPRTIENHRAKILERLGLRTSRELVRFALRRRLIPLR